MAAYEQLKEFVEGKREREEMVKSMEISPENKQTLLNFPEDSFDVITLGYIFDENIIYTDHQIGPVLGGTVSYSSVCLGRLGSKTGIVSNIGIDTPMELLQPFYDAHVNMKGLNMRKNNILNILKEYIGYIDSEKANIEDSYHIFNNQVDLITEKLSKNIV